MSKKAYYFSHDSNAKDDPKCSMLIEQLGCEGYGIYWILVETLRDQPEYKYPINMLPILARKYNTTPEKVRIVVTAYGLFELDEDQFFSLSLCRRMEKVDRSITQRIEAGKASGERRRLLLLPQKTERPFNDRSTDAEQIKVNEIKVNEINISSPFQTALKDFEQMRRKIKKPMTERARELLLLELDKIAATDIEKIAILNRSVMNCWQGVFALPNEAPAPKPSGGEIPWRMTTQQ